MSQVPGHGESPVVTAVSYTHLLVGLEASSPELGKMWTERIKGMVVYTAGDLKDLFCLLYTSGNGG